MADHSIFSYACSYLQNSRVPASKDSKANEFVDKLFHPDSASCLKNWSDCSPYWTWKATVYAQRLAGLDRLTEDKETIFAALVRQIETEVPHQILDRDLVNRLTPEQCRKILLALHEDDEISKILNEKNFKAVNHYDSQRAKGKIAALYDYMLDHNEGRPYDENQNSPGGLREIGRTDLESNTDMQFDSSENLHGLSFTGALPFLESVRDSQNKSDLRAQSTDDDKAQQILRKRKHEGWFTQVADTLKAESNFSVAMILLDALIKESTSASPERREKAMKRKVNKLFRIGLSEEGKRTVTNFIKDKAKKSKLFEGCLEKIPSHYRQKPASTDSSSDDGESPFIFNVREESSRQEVVGSINPNHFSIYESTDQPAERIIIDPDRSDPPSRIIVPSQDLLSSMSAVVYGVRQCVNGAVDKIAQQLMPLNNRQPDMIFTTDQESTDSQVNVIPKSAPLVTDDRTENSELPPKIEPAVMPNFPHDSSEKNAPLKTGELAHPMKKSGQGLSDTSQFVRPKPVSFFAKAVENASEGAKKLFYSRTPKSNESDPVSVIGDGPPKTLMRTDEPQPSLQDLTTRMMKKVSATITGTAGDVGAKVKTVLTSVARSLTINPEVVDQFNKFRTSGLAFFKSAPRKSGVALPSDSDKNPANHDL